MHLIPLTGPAMASPLPAGTTGGFTPPCARGLATPSSGLTCLFLPGTRSFQPSGGCWRGRWGRWLPTTWPEIRGKKERKGQTGLKSLTQVWSRKRGGNADGWFGCSACIYQAPGRGSPHPLGCCSPPTSPQPPQPSHTQTSSTSRSGPARHRPGEEGEMSKHGGAQGLEGERKALGKNPKEGEESGDLPLSPGEPRSGGLAQPRLERCETLQEMALCSKMSLLVAATSHLLHVEHLLLPLLQQHPLPLHPTLSKRETRSTLILGF